MYKTVLFVIFCIANLMMENKWNFSQLWNLMLEKETLERINVEYEAHFYDDISDELW